MATSDKVYGGDFSGNTGSACARDHGEARGGNCDGDYGGDCWGDCVVDFARACSGGCGGDCGRV